MKHSLAAMLVLFLSASSSMGCALLMPPQEGSQMPQAKAPVAAETDAPAPVAAKESKDQVRKGELESFAKADEATDEQLDKLEKEMLSAIRVSLGKEKLEGATAPRSATESTATLRKAKVKMHIEAAAAGATCPLSGNDDFVQLKDEGTDKPAAAKGKAAPAKTATANKLSDLRQQVSKLSFAASDANANLQQSSTQTKARVVSMVSSRKSNDMEMNDADYTLVKRSLERQKRGEAIAAATLAMLGAYEAVINNGGDPRALDVIGESTLKAFPLQASVTDDEAKAFVAGIGAPKVKTPSDVSLQGIAALKSGDSRGAINAALSFVPVPGLKDAYGFASKLLFPGSTQQAATLVKGVRRG